MISSEFKWYGDKFVNELNLIPQLFEQEAKNTVQIMQDEIKAKVSAGKTYTRTKNGITKRVLASAATGRVPPNDNFGELVDSIDYVKVHSQLYLIQSDSPYAVFLEFGTSKMAARPFFRRNVREGLQRLTQAILKRFPKTEGGIF